MSGLFQTSAIRPAMKESLLSMITATLSQYPLLEVSAVMTRQTVGDMLYMGTTPHSQTSRQQRGVDVKYAGRFGTCYPVRDVILSLAIQDLTKRSSLIKHISAHVLLSTVTLMINLGRAISGSIYITTEWIAPGESAHSSSFLESVCVGFLEINACADLTKMIGTLLLLVEYNPTILDRPSRYESQGSG
jgi:hypothetical protein